MKKNKTWTKKDEKFLIDNYRINGLKYCMNHLKRSAPSIVNRSFLLNLQKKHKDNHGRPSIPITLKYIDGTIKTFPSRKICSKETGIRLTEFSLLLKNCNRSINGWYNPVKLETPIYLYDPDDNIHAVDHILEFCLEHGLEPNIIVRMIKGTVFYYKGFRKIETPKKPKNLKRWDILISPDKKEYIVHNIAAFSRDMGIHKQGFYQLKYDNRLYNKGWLWADTVLKEYNKGNKYETVEI